MRPQDAHWDHERPLELQEGMTDMRGERRLRAAPTPALTPLGERLLGLVPWG